MKIALHCPICGNYEGIKQENENTFLCLNCNRKFDKEELLKAHQTTFEKIAKNMGENIVKEAIKKMKGNK